MFEHTHRDRDLWRGWLRNGQAVELSRSRHGWDFGFGVHVHSNDYDQGDRMLFFKFFRFTAVIPLGVMRRYVSIDAEPQWSIYASKEFGFSLHWGQRRRSWDWPWDLHTLAYEKQLPDGSWVDVFDRSVKPFSKSYSYTYVLKSGEVQQRSATVSVSRHVLCRRAFKALGWPRWSKENIDVRFSDEVGERSGSWKGGTMGCSYDLRPNETMLTALRRMEAERKF